MHPEKKDKAAQDCLSHETEKLDTKSLGLLA